MIPTAIVGLGWWGRHIVACLALEGADLRIVRGIDPRADTLTDFGEQHGFSIGKSLDEALADSSLEAVILATPHSSHESQILDCAAAGKHAFCEKPLTLTAAGARRAVEACRAAGVVLGVGHERRFEPAFSEIKQLMDGGVLGTLMHVEANFSHDLLARVDPNDWRASAAESPIPALSAMAIHLTDALLYLGGAIIEVFAYSTKRVGNWGSGDTLCIQLKLASGLTASMSTILVTPMYVRFQVFGSDAWVEARSDVHPGQRGITTLTMSHTGEDKVVQALDYIDTVRANLDAFADAVAGRADYPISDAEKIANIAVMEAIIESARTGRPIRIDDA